MLKQTTAERTTLPGPDTHLKCRLVRLQHVSKFALQWALNIWFVFHMRVGLSLCVFVGVCVYVDVRVSVFVCVSVTSFASVCWLAKRDYISIRFCGFLLCNLKQHHNKYTHTHAHRHTYAHRNKRIHIHIGNDCGFVYHIIVIDKFGKCCSKNVGTFFTHCLWKWRKRKRRTDKWVRKWGGGEREAWLGAMAAAVVVDMLNRRESRASRVTRA